MVGAECRTSAVAAGLGGISLGTLFQRQGRACTSTGQSSSGLGRLRKLEKRGFRQGVRCCSGCMLLAGVGTLALIVLLFVL